MTLPKKLGLIGRAGRAQADIVRFLGISAMPLTLARRLSEPTLPDWSFFRFCRAGFIWLRKGHSGHGTRLTHGARHFAYVQVLSHSGGVVKEARDRPPMIRRPRASHAVRRLGACTLRDCALNAIRLVYHKTSPTSTDI